MRSYTNKDGEKIEVSEQHLETAVKIKIELQKLSPSRKASLNKLVKMMEKEGFNDAENSENYRQMIKRYQKSIGELPEVEKYANMVTDGKLESIKEMVGDIAYEKRENQHVLRQLNKVKRDVIDYTLIAEQIGDAFRNHNWSELMLNYKPYNAVDDGFESENDIMIVNLTDLHIGALVDTDINVFNYEVAQYRMKKYLAKVIDECHKNGINNVYVMNLGDSIEHPYMHNLAYTSEFNMVEQILKASDLIIKFLVGLSEAGINVTTAGIGGNHDRFNENKDKSLHGDHAVKAINKSIKSFIENSKIERIIYEEAKDYSHSIEVNGVHIKFVHGDLDNVNDPNLIAKHCALDGVNYSLIVMGHCHHYRIIEQGVGKMAIMFGSLKGADNYGQNKRKVASPSQGIIIIREDGEIEPKMIKLS